jgi:Asp-tRNA(Asn)/Glu-tRNA(Gln) amidotransferase A subunit family amidase
MTSRVDASITSFTVSSIADILDGYASGSVTAVDVARICVERVESLDGKYRAWTCFDADNLVRQAAEIDDRIRSGAAVRPLEGIPVGVKDIFNTADFPTQMGSPIWKGFTPGNDARSVFNLKRAGALIPGKTETAEFAVHALGDTVNPHDPLRTPGTSSSGSAVAVALGMVPVALGTQTAGSIVRPASFCGVYGCKPSFGLIPRTGVLKTTDSLDTIGFLVAHSTDLVRVFDALRVHGADYPISNRALADPRRQQRPRPKWRVGLVRTHVWELAPAYARESLLAWAHRLETLPDVDVVDLELPAEMEAAHEVHATIYDRTLAYYFKQEFKMHELVSPIMYEIIRHGHQISVPQYETALREQERLAASMDELLKGYDIIVSLSTAGAAPLRDEREVPDPALMWTMTHLPVVSAPAFESPGGLPFGVQLAARRYNDYLLFGFVDLLREMQIIPQGAWPPVALGAEAAASQAAEQVG